MSPAQHKNADRLAANAAALVRVAAPNDWPGGFAVVADRLPGRTVGVAVGAGRGVATLYRLRPGVHAVVVDPWKVCRDVATPTAAEVVALEATALHEAAHALTNPDTTPEHAGTLLDDMAEVVPTYTPAKVAEHHGPRWAAALWVLAERALAVRPRSRAELMARVAVDVARYGYTPATLATLVAGVEPGAGLRDMLEPGGPADTLLCARLPDESTRAETIVAAGVVKAGTEVGNGCRG